MILEIVAGNLWILFIIGLTHIIIPILFVGGVAGVIVAVIGAGSLMYIYDPMLFQNIFWIMAFIGASFILSYAINEFQVKRKQKIETHARTNEVIGRQVYFLYPDTKEQIIQGSHSSYSQDFAS